MKTTKEKVIHKAGSYKMRKAVNLLRVLSLDRNLEIVNYLLKNNEANVKEIEISLRDHPQSEVSKSLKELMSFELINYFKVGTFHYYYVNREKVININKALSKFLKNVNK